MREIDFLLDQRNGSELWRTISDRFYSFLGQLCPPPIPLLEAPWEDAGFTDYLLLLRVLDGGTDFEYSAVGSAVVDATGKNVVGERLSDTALANFDRYGAAGNQGDMFALCSQAYRRNRPVELHNTFWNARRDLCTIHAALVPASSAFLEADMITGPVVIEPVVRS